MAGSKGAVCVFQDENGPGNHESRQGRGSAFTADRLLKGFVRDFLGVESENQDLRGKWLEKTFAKSVDSFGLDRAGCRGLALHLVR